VGVTHHIVKNAETLGVARQRLQGTAEEKPFPGIRSRYQAWIRTDRFDIDKRTAFPFPAVVDTLVDHDSMQPCRQGRFMTERVAVLQGAY